jgi:hypothetical protein
MLLSSILKIKKLNNITNKIKSKNICINTYK